MRLARPFFAVVLMVLAFVAGAKFAAAQSPLGIGASEPSFSSSFGPFQGVLITINHYQQQFYRALTGALKAMHDDPVKVLGLVGLSFAYGIFHAAGPGHGKAVISSYMIANETELKRGILISLLSSLAQGIMAVLLVGTAYLLLRGTAVSMGDATLFMERASFLLVAGFGAWLVFAKSRPLFSGHGPQTVALASAGADHHGQDHDEHHHHDHRHAAHDHTDQDHAERITPPPDLADHVRRQIGQAEGQRAGGNQHVERAEMDDLYLDRRQRGHHQRDHEQARAEEQHESLPRNPFGIHPAESVGIAHAAPGRPVAV